MQAIKLQFFLCYAVMGSLMAYLPLHLEANGLDSVQVAMVMGMMGLAVMVTPALVTLLADLRVPAKWLLCALFTLAGMALVAMLWARGFWAYLLIYLWHAMALVPVIPVQDGLFFSLQRQRLATGLLDEPYHHVRVWGTIGFIVPSLVLYVLMRGGGPTMWAVMVGATMCFVNAGNCLFLPHAEDPGIAVDRRGSLPTLAAARRIFSPELLPFVLALWLVLLATSAYYTFYPRYLVHPPIHIAREWVGLVTCLGVVIEILFILSFQRLLHMLGLRRLLILASGATALRMALLWLVPVPIVAVGTQVFHGLMVLLIHVAPPVYLNQHADHANRSSMQGLFAMLILGTSRIAGNLIAAPLAMLDLRQVFFLCAALCTAGMLLLSLRFRETSVAHHASGHGREKAVEQ